MEDQVLQMKQIDLEIVSKQQTETRKLNHNYRPKNKFDKKDIIRILTELSFPYSKPEVDQWIWEVDEDLD